MLGFYSFQVQEFNTRGWCHLEASIDELPTTFWDKSRKYIQKRAGKDLFQAAQAIEANHQNQNLKFRKSRYLICSRAVGGLLGKGISPSHATAYQSIKHNSEQSIARQLPDIDEIAEVQATAQELLERLRKKLFKSKQYKLSIYHQQEKRTTTKLLSKALIPFEGNSSSLQDLVGDRDQLIRFCCSNKEDSIAFQDFLQEADSKTLGEIGQYFSEKLEELLTDKFGNYTVQKLCYRQEEFLEQAAAFLRSRFESLVDNEYASRVMQALVDLSPSFRAFCLAKFKNSLPGILTSISAVFLISAVIKSTQDFEELAFLREMITTNPSLLECRYLKRVMVSYVDNCPDSELVDIIRALKIRGNLCSFLDDKYSAYIVLMLVQRGDKGTIQELITTIKQNPALLFGSKFAGFLLTKVIELSDNDLNTAILASQLTITPINFRRMVQSTSLDTGHFFLYLVLSIKPLARHQVQYVQNLLNALPTPFNSTPSQKARAQIKKTSTRPLPVTYVH